MFRYWWNEDRRFGIYHGVGLLLDMDEDHKMEFI